MIPNHRLLRHLAILELALALLFAGISLYAFLRHPDSLSLQLMLVVIGLAGVLNGLFLFRKVKQSRQRPRPRPERAPSASAANRTAKGRKRKGNR